MSPSQNPKPGTSRSSNMASPASTPIVQKRQPAQKPIKDPKKQKTNKIAADPTEEDKKENGRGLKDTLHGIIYQLKLLMLFSYRCYFVKYNFRLYTEKTDAEKFDDVVLGYFLDNVQGFIFLQAKHSLKKIDNEITCAHLRAADNRFALHKYFTSYMKIKRNDKFKSDHKHFIINTNLGFKFDEPSDKTNLNQLGDLYFKSFKIKSNPALKLLNVGGDYYQLTKCTKTLQSWFVEKTDFDLLAEKLAECLVNEKKIDFNQPLFKIYHSALVKEVIDTKHAKLADNFINDSNLSSEAQDFRQIVLQIVEKTHKINRKDFLERMAVNKSLVFSKSFKTFKDSNNNSLYPNREVSVEDVEGFMNDCIFAVNQPNENELGEIITQKIGQDLKLISSDLAYNNYSKKILDWFKKKSSLPLTQFDIRAILENTDVEITTIESSGQTKLLVDKLKVYGMSFRKESLSEELLNFVKSSETGQKRICILENPDTLIGSLKVNQALRKKCKYNDGFIFIKLSYLLLEQEVVMKALKNDKMRLIIVVCELQDKDVTEIYKLLSEHLKNKQLLLVGSKEHPLIKSFLSPNLSFVVKQENRFSDFTFVAQQIFLEKKVTFQGHKIALNRLVDDQQDNINNLMLKTGLLESKTENIGDKIQESIGYNIKYYIDRNFQKGNKESKKYSTQDLLNKLRKHTHKKFMIITDTAGMGKSTVITHLSLKIKKANPHFWVVRIDLNATTEAFIKHKDELTSNNVVEFIVDKLLKLKTEVEKELFKHLIKEKRVVLMLDAFDEIRPSYEKKGIEFFESLKEINLRQIWITTRPYLKNEQKPELSLNELFPGDQVDSLAITPFSRENQKEFLKKLWSQNRYFNQWQLDSIADNLIYNLKQSIRYSEEFTSIPLHLFMLAKIYEPDENSIKKLIFQSEIKIDLFSLYQQFLNTKIHINMNKCATSEHNDAKTEQTKANKGEINLWKAYEHSAIELIFPHEAKYFLDNIERETVSSNELFRSGIVVTTNGSIRFVHRTFAEYFAVQFIMKQLTKAHPNEFLQGFFVKIILTGFFSYGMIRKFLNSFIEQSYQKDSKIRRLKDMGELIKEACNEQVKNEDICWILNNAVKEENSYIIKFLSDNLNVENYNKFRKLLIKCFISKKNRDLFDDFSLYNKINSQVFDELFEWIKNCNFSIDNDPLVEPDVDECSFWVSAINSSCHRILKKIWDYCKIERKCSDADLKTKLLLSKFDGEYLLFIALSKDYFNILEYLWKCAEEIKAQKELIQCKNNEGQTLMQVMILRTFARYKIIKAAPLFLEFSNFYEEFLSLKLKKKENIETDQKLSKKRLSMLKFKLKLLSYEHFHDYVSILYSFAYIGDTEIFDEIWWIAKEILYQDQLKTLLMKTDEDGNKTWLFVALQCEDSPLEKAQKLGWDAGLGDELRQELLQIQDRPDIVNLKEELLARKKEISEFESTNEFTDDDS